MKRILTTTLAVSVLVLPACKGGAAADAAKLVPDEADFIAGLSPKAISESELYKKLAPKFESEDDYKKAVAMFEDCGLKPLEFDAVVVGANQSGEQVIVVVGDGVGKKDEATCAVNKFLTEAGKEANAEVVKESGNNVIDVEDFRVFLVSDKMLAIASSDWKDSVAELIDGKGKPAVENSKKDLMGKVDTKKAIWFVANIPPELAGMAAMAGPELTEIKTAVGSIDLSKGLAMELVAGFGDDDKAKAAADKIQALNEMGKGQTPEELKGMSESVKIEASGSDVKLSASASMDEVEAAMGQLPM